MTTEASLEELERLAREATPGPWELQDGSSWRRIGTRDGNGNVLCPYNSPSDQHPDLCAGRGEDVYANLRFIVAANPSAVLSLLSRVKELEGALMRLETANDALCAKRSRATYLAMIDNDGCGDELLALDNARDLARSALHPEGGGHG